ncbi:Holin of 3TMs, for gene-transfer release [uncultured Caudovirales phage]|uniref:Holin of 3TMs, for gene-transfer release n=1 Tax=uncultured Caudovirales phage TaxID=2100421 RepID=A0A6J5L7L0_9CAUD|nr:Holin of 3TMs, for gene-transfer release [uncultured Caudovirales phage]
MNFLGIGTVIESVGKVAGDLITTDKERMQLELEGRKLDQAIDLAQIEVNKVEAASLSVFVAGWRPAIGWIGAAAMAYQFLVYPLALWIWAYLQGIGWIPKELTPPPVLPADQLWVILSGILGIAGMRSFEKTKGVAAR